MKPKITKDIIKHLRGDIKGFDEETAEDKQLIKKLKSNPQQIKKRKGKKKKAKKRILKKVAKKSKKK